MQNLTDATNISLIQTNMVLFPFVKNAGIFRCPADVSTDNGTTIFPYGGVGTPRVRSMSMNCYMNFVDPNPANNQYYYPDAVGLGVAATNYRKSTSIRHPTNIFVFLDENPASIDDGLFTLQPNSGSWVNAPASYHNNAGGLSFADGHAEIKVWRDSAILKHLTAPALNTTPTGNAADLKWLEARTTE
jgi:prepilin-type processing-associated H-X9-DG protein